MPRPVLIFLLAYLGVALGRIPGLTLDRTGLARLEAIAHLLTRAAFRGMKKSVNPEPVFL